MGSANNLGNYFDYIDRDDLGFGFVVRVFFEDFSRKSISLL